MQLTKLQSQLHQFASKSDIKPVLQAVMTDGRTAVATDSFRLVEITAINETKENPLMISGPSLKSHIKYIKERAQITKEGARIVGVEKGSFILEPSEATPDEYPRYESIFPTTEPLAQVRVNGRMLAEIVELLAKLNTAEEVTLALHGIDRPIVITGRSSISAPIPQTARAMIMPIVGKPLNK